MKKIPKRYYYDVAGFAVMLIAYFILLYYCANNDVVSQMLCGTGTSKSLSAAMAVIFIALRLFIIVLLPGCVLARIGLLLNHLYLENKQKEDHVDKINIT